MDQQEQAFLEATLEVGDARLERRLLVGYHLLREGCRLADDPAWVPRPRVAREAIDAAIADGTFAPGDIELVALARLLGEMERDASTRPARYAALLGYGIALVREANMAAAHQVFRVMDRLWSPECEPVDRMESVYYTGLTLLRGPFPIAASATMPIVLALQAKANRSPVHVGLAMMLRIERTVNAGNLPAALRQAERLMARLDRHPSTRVEGVLLSVLGVIHGRAGRFEQVLRYAHRALEPQFHFTVRLSGLHLAANALMDLGDYPAAQAAFELLLLSPTQAYRRWGWLGLLDAHERLGERQSFERIYERLLDQPLLTVQRIQLFQLAGRAWARLHDVARARRAFDRAHAIARECGYGMEIIETEQDMARLLDPVQRARAADIAPTVAARVTAMRDSHAEAIATCMA
jgi:tetratricopeptide (TPR) repeat protein